MISFHSMANKLPRK